MILFCLALPPKCLCARTSLLQMLVERIWQGMWCLDSDGKHTHRVGHRIPNLLSSLFGLRSFATFIFYKVCFFFAVPFRIYSIDIVSVKNAAVFLCLCSKIQTKTRWTKGSEFGVPSSVHVQKAYTSLGTSSMQILLLFAHAYTLNI